MIHRLRAADIVFLICCIVAGPLIAWVSQLSKARLYYWLDRVESAWRRYWKVRRLKRTWGDQWENCSRPGRVYKRVELGLRVATGEQVPVLLEAPGWFWVCFNCKTYSLITDAMLPAICAEWERRSAETLRLGFKVTSKRPTAATAGCPNCKALPGDPE